MHVAKNNIMSVDVPQIEYEELESGRDEHLSLWHASYTTGELDVAVDRLAEALPGHDPFGGAGKDLQHAGG